MESPVKFDIILACDKEYGIGKCGGLPWKISQDMKFFKVKTSYIEPPYEKNAIIMGYRTWESLEKCSLPDRLTIVVGKITETLEDNDVIKCETFQDALDYCAYPYMVEKVQNIYVIGGSALFNEAIVHTSFRTLYLNELDTDYDCDIILNKEHFNNLELVETTNCVDVYDSKNNQKIKMKMNKYKSILYRNEKEYLNLLEEVYTTGKHKEGRNGETLSLFGKRMEFNLENNKIPLITTRRQFVRGIFEELMWFIRGSTDVRELNEKKIHFWDGNTTKEFIQSQNLAIDLPEKCLGAGYGFQMRCSGADYTPFKSLDEYDSEPRKVDQLMEVINSLKTDPMSRRHLISLWTPHDIKKMALVPCHGIAIQFYCIDMGDYYNLSCSMYQRSGDMFHGVPFNITSYSLFTHMIAHHINNSPDYTGKPFKPHRLIMTIGDAHIYTTHLGAVSEQLTRSPYINPTISFTEIPKSIDNYRYETIKIHNYMYHSNIKKDMVA